MLQLALRGVRAEGGESLGAERLLEDAVDELTEPLLDGT